MSLLGVQILDLLIGLLFIYFIFSLIASTLVELISNVLKVRAKNLEAWITSMFDTRDTGGSMGEKLMKNFYIDGLTKAGTKASYIPGNLFAKAVFAEVAKHAEAARGGAEAIDAILTSAPRLKEEILRSPILSKDQALLFASFIDTKQADLTHAVNQTSLWYDQAMERVGGTYKKFAQQTLLLVAFAMSVLLNIDTIALVRYLQLTPEVRKNLADLAIEASTRDLLWEKTKKRVMVINNDTIVVKPSLTVPPTQPMRNPKDLPIEQGTPTQAQQGSYTYRSAPFSEEEVQRNVKELQVLSGWVQESNLPLGWSDVVFPTEAKELWWLTKIIGILVSAFAISINANIWFDLLNKLVNMRATGKKPLEKPEEKDPKSA